VAGVLTERASFRLKWLATGCRLPATPSSSDSGLPGIRAVLPREWTVRWQIVRSSG